MVCNLVGLYNEFCSCLIVNFCSTEIQDNKMRYIELKNDLSKLWRQIQLSALRYSV